jgi:DNA-binding beta-propeller fold protein YncE
MTFGNKLFNPLKGEEAGLQPYIGDNYKEANRLIVPDNITLLSKGPNESILYAQSNVVYRINQPEEDVTIQFDQPITAIYTSGEMVYIGTGNQLFSATYKKESAKTLIKDFQNDIVISSIASTSNLIYVSDIYTKTVKAINKSGETQFEIKGDPEFLIPGTQFPIDQYDNQLWVTDTGRHNIQIFNTNGTYVSTWQPSKEFPGCCNPIDFSILKGGKLITLQKGISEINLFSPSGEYLEAVAATNAFQSVSSRKEMAVFSEDAIVIFDSDINSLRFFIKKQ